MMSAIHRVQLKWGKGIELELEWVKGRGIAFECAELPDEFVYVEEEVELDRASLEGVPPICYRSHGPALFEPFQLRENTDYFIDITVPITKESATREMGCNPGWPFVGRLANVFQVDPPRRWRIDSNGHVVISGVIRLRSHAGILDLSTTFGHQLRMEVVCQKIGYLDEFKALLDQVANELAELLLQYDSPVSSSFNISDVSSTNEAGLLFQLRHIMAPENLPASIDEIMGQLHVMLYTRHGVVALEEAEEPDIEALATALDVSNLQAGGPIRRFFCGYIPRAIPILERYESTDTPENRYVKYFLEEILLLSTRLKTRLLASGKSASAREASVWVDRLDEILSSNVWKGVSQFQRWPSNSQVLQRGRGYRDILKYDLTLRMGLELPWKRGEELAEGLYGDLRPVSELYEYWCFFVLRNSLADICVREMPRKGTLINVSPDGLRVSLRKGKRSKNSFVYKDTSEARIEVNLFYNRKFKRPNRAMSSWLGSYTANFDPDYSVEVVVTRKDTVAQRHWLHFDAKYRLEREEVNALFVEETGVVYSDDATESSDTYASELKRVYKRDDLFKMHTYRDGILSSRGAYIIYPGNDDSISLAGNGQNLFVRHPSAFGGVPRFKTPSVGAFSLSPRAVMAQRGVLSGFLNEVLDGLSSSIGYIEESGTF